MAAVCLAAGQWQWSKAQTKNERQRLLAARGAQSALTLPTQATPSTLSPTETAALAYRRVVVRGRYETAYQILVDNRTYRQQAGFHVVTPLRIAGSERVVLVNRGWLPALAEHHRLPQFATPGGVVEVSGTAVLPPQRFFTLGEENGTQDDRADGAVTGKWASVWQHLDLKRYADASGLATEAVVVERDADRTAGGFVREWRRPDQGIFTNFAYALQWWAFAATTLTLWLYFSFRRRR